MSESLSTPVLTSQTLPRLPVFRVARRGGAALGIKLVGAGIALLLQISLTRALGFNGYGEFAYAFGWLQLTLVFAQGGFSTAALRFVAEYRASRQVSLLRGFLRRATQIALFEALALSAVMIAVVWLVQDRLPKSSVDNLLIAALTLPLLSQFAIHSTIVRGLGEAIPSMLTSLVQPTLLALSVALVMSLSSDSISSTSAMWLNLAAALCTLVVVVALQRSYEPRELLDTQPSYHTKEWTLAATQMMFASGLVFLHGRTGVVASGLLLSEEAAGTYALAERISDAACLGLAAVNLLVGPSIAALYAQGRLLELQRYARLAAGGAAGFMLLTVVPLVFAGRQILELFGPDFIAGYPALLILLCGASLSALCGCAILMLSMTGHHRLNTATAASCLLLNVSLSVVFIPKYGIVGTALANAISITVWNITLMFLAKWKLGIWTNVGRIGSLQIF